MHSPAEASCQEILHPALYHMCLCGRRQRLKHLPPPQAEQRDTPPQAEQRDDTPPPLAFCPPANLRTIRESIPNARLRNESYSRQYSQQPFHLLLHKPPFHDRRLWLSRYLQLDIHPIAFRKSSFCKPRNYSSKSEGMWIRDAVATNTSHGVWGCGRDPRPSRIQASYPASSRQKVIWRLALNLVPIWDIIPFEF